MTLKTFYNLALTTEGIQKIYNTFNNLNTLKQFYKANLNLNDLAQWNNIAYIPIYGKCEIYNNKFYGELLHPFNWELFTMFDLLNLIIFHYSSQLKQPKNIACYYSITKYLFSILNGEHPVDLIVYFS